MPELSDVEGHRRVVEKHALNRRIHEVRVHDRGVLADEQGTDDFVKALRERRISGVDRHGKWLLVGTDGPTVLFHFGMTGRLVWARRDDAAHPHDRVVFALDDGELRYRDMRKLQGIRLAYTDSEISDRLAPIGPDANAIKRDEFRRLLAGHRKGIKSALMDQHVLAGLGNLLVDEILWQSRVAPKARTDQLDGHTVDTVHRTMQRVLRTSIRAEHVPRKRSWLTGARDAPDPDCPRCGRPLRRGTVASRTTVWCPHCQR